MKNANSAAPRAAPYSAPCCSRGPRTAPRAVRIPDYSAPCCSQAHFEAVRTAPGAVLISITRRSPFSFVPLHRFGAVAPGCCCTSFQASGPNGANCTGRTPCTRCTGCTTFTSARRSPPGERPMPHSSRGRPKVEATSSPTRAPPFLRASAEFEFRCEVCGGPLRDQATGRPRRYCTDACRQKAHRIRRALKPA